MKTKHFGILIILALGIHAIRCDQDSHNPLSLSGEMVSHSACKSGLKSASADSAAPDSVSCIEYSFDEVKNKLAILHRNAGFNCSPESLYCAVALIEDTILIREYESDAQCRCDCLYDLDIVISGVEAKKYQVKVIEPYAGNQEKILFGIDLEKEREGSFCAIRKQYPWGRIGLNP
jgi:hypothetical protein